MHVIYVCICIKIWDKKRNKDDVDLGSDREASLKHTQTHIHSLGTMFLPLMFCLLRTTRSNLKSNSRPDQGLSL